MGKAARERGKRGEREIAELLRRLGYMDAHRTAQYCGKSGEAADVIGVDGLHIEVKRCETTKIHEWIRQAERDSEETENIPCVFHRRSREPWYITLPLIDFLQIYREAGYGIKRVPKTGAKDKQYEDSKRKD